jgi:hypothetical protein
MSKALRKCKSGWRRELGTSKKAQGIVTPKAPRRGVIYITKTKRKSVMDAIAELMASDKR